MVCRNQNTNTHLTTKETKSTGEILQFEIARAAREVRETSVTDRANEVVALVRQVTVVRL